MRILAALCFSMAAVSASAQGGASRETLCNPASNPYDAVRAAPNSHRVVFEDEHVRVLQILLPPLAAEPIHIHALPSVIMGDTGGGAGAKFVYTEYRFENGKFVEVKKEEVSPTPGYRAVYSLPEGPHSITNIGPVGVEYTRVELKPESCAK